MYYFYYSYTTFYYNNLYYINHYYYTYYYFYIYTSMGYYSVQNTKLKQVTPLFYAKTTNLTITAELRWCLKLI